MVIEVETGKSVINRVVKFSWTVTVLGKLVCYLFQIIHYPMEELGMSFNGENLFFFYF